MVGHVDHGLRPDSAADAEWVSRLASDLGLDCIVRKADVQSLVDHTSMGVEEAGRTLRYQCLNEIAVEQTCSVVTTAHTADDQVETVLHHILRGTGLRGLCGMPETRPMSADVILLRPFLTTSRTVVAAALSELDQAYRTDATNTDEGRTRSRIRHLLIPLLREEFSTTVDESILRLSHQASEVLEMMRSPAVEKLDHALIDANPWVAKLNCRVLERSPRPLIREILRLLWEVQGWPQAGMDFHRWEMLATSVMEQGDRSVENLPGGFCAQRRGEMLVLQQLAGSSKKKNPASKRIRGKRSGDNLLSHLAALSSALKA